MVRYDEYLRLPQLLQAQQPRTPCHDETFFIVVHQCFELWFKQILLELEAFRTAWQTTLSQDGGEVPLTRLLRRLDRVDAIFELMFHHFHVVDKTLEATDFLRFRDAIAPASGFQSVQFRLLEARLGLGEAKRVHPARCPRALDVLSAQDRRRIDAECARESLADLLKRHLRTMWAASGCHAWPRTVEAWTRYRQAQALSEDHPLASRWTLLCQQSLAGTDWSCEELKSALVALAWGEDGAAASLSHTRTLLLRLQRLDAHLSEWRTRHSRLVYRVLGHKTGTGGSAGHGYLHSTIKYHTVFSDVALATSLLFPLNT